MKKTLEKGFTLVELLAIITILGVIVLIITPKIKDTIDESKMKAFEDTAYGIIRASNLYYARKEMMGEVLEEIEFEFPDNAEELRLQGKLPKSGSVIIAENGDISLAIENDKYCITKGYNDKEITVTKDYETCILPNNGPKLITFTINSFGTIIEYQAEEGMTWEEFVNSDYNDGYVVAINPFIGADGFLVKDINTASVIIDGMEYIRTGETIPIPRD